MKIAFSICFALSHSLQRQHVAHGAVPQSGTAKLPPWKVNQYQGTRALTLVCICALSQFICTSVSKIVLRYQKNLKEDIFGVQECSRFFPYKLIVTASSLYTILVYKTFHKESTFRYGENLNVYAFTLETNPTDF